MKESHKTVYDIISALNPFDETEKLHVDLSLQWIAKASEIFRIEKPATPNMHLVSYFTVLDLDAKKILLVDHKKANLWLPSGGHVEPQEHPMDTVQREVKEELDIEADFLCQKPIFLTVTQTVGNITPHTDVSLWYALRGSQNHIYAYDQEEFHQIRWFSMEDIPWDRSEPHLYRFIQKLSHTISLM
jgi:ADP-ribose pyrophosphatase YjhB (NUDIX family)